MQLFTHYMICRSFKLDVSHQFLSYSLFFSLVSLLSATIYPDYCPFLMMVSYGVIQAFIAAMVNASLHIKNLSKEAAIPKRSSPRLLGKGLEPANEKVAPCQEKVLKKRHRLCDAREEYENSAVPVMIKAYGTEESNSNPAQIVADTSAHNLVVKTLRKFNKHYLHFVQVCILMADSSGLLFENLKASIVLLVIIMVICFCFLYTYF